MGNLVSYYIGTAIILYPAWRIFQRAGLNPALSLLLLIPLVGYIIALCVLGFSKWPQEMGREGFR